MSHEGNFPISEDLHERLIALFVDPEVGVSHAQLAGVAPSLLAEVPTSGPPYKEAMHRLLQCVEHLAFSMNGGERFGGVRFPRGGRSRSHSRERQRERIASHPADRGMEWRRVAGTRYLATHSRSE